MAEVNIPCSEIAEKSDENLNESEPKFKKQKVVDVQIKGDFRLEERLNGILCCVVCFDLPAKGVFQVSKTICSCKFNAFYKFCYFYSVAMDI